MQANQYFHYLSQLCFLLFCYLALLGYYSSAIMLLPCLFHYTLEYILHFQLSPQVHSYIYFICTCLPTLYLGFACTQYVIVAFLGSVVVLCALQAKSEYDYCMVFGMIWFAAFGCDAKEHGWDISVAIQLALYLLIIASHEVVPGLTNGEKPSLTILLLFFALLSAIALDLNSALDLFHIAIGFLQVLLLFLTDFAGSKWLNVQSIMINWPSYVQSTLYHIALNRLHEWSQKDIKKLQLDACSTQVIQSLSKNLYLLQKSLLFFPDLELLNLLIRRELSFIGWKSRNPPFLHQLRTALNKNWEAADRDISRKQVVSDLISCTQYEQMPAWKLWQEMEVKLARMETKLAVLWLVRKKIVGGASKLPRSLLLEVTEYL